MEPDVDQTLQPVTSPDEAASAAKTAGRDSVTGRALQLRYDFSDTPPVKQEPGNSIRKLRLMQSAECQLT
jgi:hypothetical protein